MSGRQAIFIRQELSYWDKGAWPYEGGGYWFDGLVRPGYALHADFLGIRVGEVEEPGPVAVGFYPIPPGRPVA